MIRVIEKHDPVQKRVECSECHSLVEFDEKKAVYQKGSAITYRGCECPICGNFIEDEEFTHKQVKNMLAFDRDNIRAYYKNRWRWPWKKQEKVEGQ